MVMGMAYYELEREFIDEPCTLRASFVYVCGNRDRRLIQPSATKGSTEIWRLEPGEYVIVDVFRSSCKSGFEFEVFTLHVDKDNANLSKVMYGVARHFALALKVALERVNCRGGE
jgi:hypothetical protein